MKIGKRISLTLFILFSAVLAFGACGKDPYKNMQLTITSGTAITHELSDDEGENYFDVVASVTGVKSSDVNTDVVFTPSDTRKIVPANAPIVNGGVTTQRFKVLDTGHAIITVSTVEGGNSGVKTKHVDVQITRHIDELSFTYSLLPIVRGVDTDITKSLYDGSNFVTYAPSNTTQRDITLKAVDSATLQELDGVQVVGTSVKVTDADISEFKLVATSTANEEITAITDVQVLDAINEDSFTLTTTTNGGEEEEVEKMLFGDDNIYSIAIANGDSTTNDHYAKRIDVLKDGVSISETQKYTLSATNMNSTQTAIVGLNHLSARKDMQESITLSEGRGVGMDTLTLLVSYKGFENIFAPVEIPVNISVNIYPTTINFVKGINDTNSMTTIPVYINTNYYGIQGTSVYLKIFSNNGSLINQTAYVYPADKTTLEPVTSGIMVFHFVGGVLTRVYANTPVKHGEQLFINYVAGDVDTSKDYVLVANSTFFKDVFSYNGDGEDKHEIQLITGLVNVSMPSVSLAKGSADDRELTAHELFGTDTPAIRKTDLTITTSDENMLKVVYDYINDKVYLSSMDATKIGEVTVTVTAPNGRTASTKSYVYTNTSVANTFLKVGNNEYVASDTDIYTISVLAGTGVYVNVVIDGDVYDNIDNVLPSGLNIMATSFNPNHITMGDSGIVFFAGQVNTTTEITFTFTNDYSEGDDLVYTFAVAISRPVSEIVLNTTSVPMLYDTRSITMPEYKSYTLQTITATPNPNPEDNNGTFTFAVYTNILQNYSGKTRSETYETYEYSVNDGAWLLYIKAYGESISEGTQTIFRLNGTFDVWTVIDKANDENTYSFDLLITYSRSYINLDETFDVSLPSRVEFKTQKASRVSSINATTSQLQFNTNDFEGEDGAYTKGNAQVFSFSLRPTFASREIFDDTIYIWPGNNTSLDNGVTLDGVTTYSNEYLTLVINNTTKSVVVTVISVPTDRNRLTQNFMLVAKDSSNLGTNAKRFNFSVKINDGTSISSAFVITTPQQFLKINNSLDSYYRLGADIDLSLYYADDALQPFGSYDNHFTGWFSGEYAGVVHTIYGLRMVNSYDSSSATPLRTNAIGLFAVNDGVISNVNITNFLVRVNYGGSDTSNVYVGAVAGINNGYIHDVRVVSNDAHPAISGTYISDISTSNTPTSGVVYYDYSNNIHDAFVGGVVGVNAGYISNVYVNVDMFGHDTTNSRMFAGGVAGANTYMPTTRQTVLTFKQSELNNPYVAFGVLNDGLETSLNSSSEVESMYARMNALKGNIAAYNTLTQEEKNLLDNLIVEYKHLIDADDTFERIANRVQVLRNTYYALVRNNYNDAEFAYREISEVVLNIGNIANGNIESEIDTFNVTMLFNSFAHGNDYRLINAGSAVGGVVGINTINADASGLPSIVGMVVRAYIVAKDNVGGVAGINYAEIERCTVQVNIIANDYVGGITGINKNDLTNDRVLNGNYDYVQDADHSLRGTIVSSKVQFVNRLDSNTDFNTSIKANNYVGGIVGKHTSFAGDYTPITYTYVSAYSYSDSAIGSTNSNGGQYLGDIVASGVYVGGFVGHAENLVMVNCLSNVKISASSVSQVGGLVSKLVGTFDAEIIQVSGVVSGVEHAGGFVYDASEVIPSDYALRASYTVIKQNGNFVTNIAYINAENITTSNAMYIGCTVKDSADNDVIFTDVVSKTYATYNDLKDYYVDPEDVSTLITNYIVYDGSSYDIGYDETLSASYNYYYNTSLFDSRPVAFGSYTGVVDGKLCLVFEVAPTSISLTANNAYAINGDNSMAVVKHYSDDEYEYNTLNLSDVINAAITPSFASAKFVVSSSNTNVVRVQNGKLVIVSSGMTYITYTSLFDANVSTTIKLFVINDTMWSLTNLAGESSFTALEVVKNYSNSLIGIFSGGQNAYVGMQVESENYKGAIAINGIGRTDDDRLVGGTAYDFDGVQLIIDGLRKETVSLYVNPYVKIKYYDSTTSTWLEQKIYLGGTNVTVRVVNGSFELSTISDVRINPTASEEIKVIVRTDEQNLSMQMDVNLNIATASYSITQLTDYEDVLLFSLRASQESDFQPQDNTHPYAYKTFTFDARVDENKYGLVRANIVYQVTVALMLYNGRIVTETFHIVVIPQELTTVVIKNFQRVYYENIHAQEGSGTITAESVASLSDAEVSMYKYDSETIVPGYAGLMQINLHPWYGRFDYVDITASNSAMTFEQMVESENLGQFSKMIRYNGYASISNGIRINNIYSAINGTYTDYVDYTYDGRLFVRLTCASTLQNSDQTVTVRCYLNDGTCVWTEVKTLHVVEPPRITITMPDNTTFGEIAVGTSVKFNVAVYGNPDEIKSNYNLVPGENIYSHNARVLSTDEIYAQIGRTITISGSVSKDIAGTKYVAEASITLLITKFVINSISIKNVSNGYFVGKYNQIYELRSIVNATYYIDDKQEFANDVRQDIKNLEKYIDRLGLNLDPNDNQLTYKMYKDGAYTQLTMYDNASTNGGTLTWYTVNGSNVTPLVAGGDYLNFNVRSVKQLYQNGNDWVETGVIDTLSIQNTNVYGKDLLECLVKVSYNKSGLPIITTHINSAGNASISELDLDADQFINHTRNFPTKFRFNFSRELAEETPDPIYNVQQFIDALYHEDEKNRGYYILQADLVLDNWTPREANFASLDGNMHVITINSFNLDGYTGSNIGLFSSLSSTYDSSKQYNSCFIQNLVVEIPQDVYLDISGLNNVNVGIVAGSNDGVITNSRVVNDAQDVINERLDMQIQMRMEETENSLNEYLYNSVTVNALTGETTYGELNNEKRMLMNVLNEVVGFDNFVPYYLDAKYASSAALIPTTSGFLYQFDESFHQALKDAYLEAKAKKQKYEKDFIKDKYDADGNLIEGEYEDNFVSGFKPIYSSYATQTEFIDNYYSELTAAYRDVVKLNDYATLKVFIQNFIEYLYTQRAENDILTTEHVLSRYKQWREEYSEQTNAVEDALDKVIELPVVPEVYFKGNVASSQNNRIALFAGKNNGYITNSAVDNVSIRATDYVAGFVSSNTGTISSSYFRGGNIISEDGKSKQNSATAGFVVDNGGSIQYCYVQGRYAVPYSRDDISGFDETTRLTFAGYKAFRDYVAGDVELESFATLRAFGSAIRTNASGAGFVYTNTGFIGDSYSNILVSGIGAAFVLDNHSTDAYIENCYTMSSGGGSGFSAFTSTAASIDNISNSFYLCIDSQDTENETYYDETTLSDLSKVAGTALSAMGFNDYNSFQSYAFNVDYYKNADKYVINNVWFIPTQNTTGSTDVYTEYFRHSSTYLSGDSKLTSSDEIVAHIETLNTTYSNNRPELVSANLRYTRYRVYHEKVQNSAEATSADKGFEYFDAQYRYNGLACEYGKTLINPYYIDTAAKFNAKAIANTDMDENTDTNTATTAYLKFVRDITFDNETQTAQTYNTVFKGDLDGNGMTINNLRILADNGQNNAFSFGLFSRIEGANVRNLNVMIEELWGVNVPVVGVLAGVITDRVQDGITTWSTISNIKIDSQSDIVVQGLNVVGGVAGIVEGHTTMVNVTSDVAVKSNYRGNINLFSRNNSVNNVVNGYNLLDITQIGIDNITDTSSASDRAVYSSISYAGGVAGVINVQRNPEIGTNVKLRNYANIRRNYITYGNLITAQVVGGLFGYVSKTSEVGDVYVLTDGNLRLNASRVAGGIVGHNLGVINRSFVSHTLSTQELIDKNINSQASSLDNASRDIVLNYVDYDMFMGNPHYMGGIAGINIGYAGSNTVYGRITNSYNKVPVNNMDAEFAGGIVGLNVSGELDNVYCTATVNAFRGIGGIIGIQTQIEYENNKNVFKNLRSSTFNYHYELSGLPQTLNTETVLKNVVGANVWLTSHLNTNRSNRFERNALDGYLGTLVGLTTYGFNYVDVETKKEIAGFSLAEIKDRLISESNIFKATLAFESIGRQSPRSYVKEIGYYEGVDNYRIDQNEALLGLSNRIESEHYRIYSQDDHENVKLLRGIYTIGSTAYSFSRLTPFGSYRSLTEIIARASSTSEANKLYRDYLGNNFITDYGIGSSWINVPDDTTYTDKKHTEQSTDPYSLVYYNWSYADWDGIGLNNEGVKIDAQCIFPAISTRLERSVVKVYTENDLKLMNVYKYADFILYNDITLTSAWSAVGSNKEPFQGSVYSKKNEQGQYMNYTIQNFTFNSSDDITGLVAYADKASFHHFQIEVDDCSANTKEGGEGKTLAVLVANAIECNINNITIKKSSDSSSSSTYFTINATNVAQMGLLVANGEDTVITDCAINNAKLVASHASSGDTIYVGLAFGKLTGDHSWVDNIIVESGSIDVTVDTWQIGQPDNIAVGGIGGWLEIAPYVVNEETVDNITTASAESVDVRVDVTYNLSRTPYVGGMYGYVCAYTYGETKVEFTDLYNDFVTVRYYLEDGATATTSYVGGLIGSAMGGVYHDISSYVTVLGATDNLVVGGVFGDAIYAELNNIELSPTDSGDPNIKAYTCKSSSGGYIGGIVGWLEEYSIATNLFVHDDCIIQVHGTYDNHNEIDDIRIGGAIGELDNSIASYVVVDAMDINVQGPIIDGYSDNPIIKGSASIGGVIGFIGVDDESVWSSNIGLHYALSNANIYVSKIEIDTTDAPTHAAIGGLVGDYYDCWGVSEISYSYATGNIDINDVTNEAYVGGLVGWVSSEAFDDDGHYIGDQYINNCYSIVNYITNTETKYNNVKYKGNLFGMTPEVIDFRNVSNVYATFEINPNLKDNEYDLCGNILTLSDMLELDEDSFSSATVYNTSTVFPILQWIEGMSNDDFGHGIATHSQDSGTRQNPYNVVVGENNEYLDEGSVYITGQTNSWPSEIDLADNAYVIINFDIGEIDLNTIPTGAVVIWVNKPDSAATASFGENSAGKIINGNLATGPYQTVINNPAGLVVFNCDFSDATTLYYAVRSNYQQSAIFTNCEFNFYVLIDFARDTNGVPPALAFNNCYLICYPSGSIKYKEHVQTWCDGLKVKDTLFNLRQYGTLVYVNNQHTIEDNRYVALETSYGLPNDLDYDGLLGVDLAKFTLMPANSDGELYLVPSWELKEHWYDEDIKAEYRWNSVDVPSNYTASLIKDNPTNINVDINSAEDLAVFAKWYNSEGRKALQRLHSGLTITVNINADIDLGGKLWDPINDFKGTINGNGHKISYMTVYCSDKKAYGGFVGSTSGNVVIQDLMFDWSTVMSDITSSQPNAGVIIGRSVYNITLERVAVSKAAVYGASGMVGAFGDSNYSNLLLKINNCYLTLVKNNNQAVADINNNITCLIQPTKVKIRSVSDLSSAYDAANKVMFDGASYFTRINGRSADGVSVFDDLKDEDCLLAGQLIGGTIKFVAQNYSLTNKAQVCLATKTDGGVVYSPNMYADYARSPKEGLGYVITRTYSAGPTGKFTNWSITPVTETQLKTEDLAGFDWGTTWIRNLSSTDSYGCLPQLRSHVPTWRDYAIENATSIKESLTKSDSTFIIDSAAKLAYVAWQLGLDSGEDDFDNRFDFTSVSSITFKIAANIDLGGRIWTPIEFNDDNLSASGTSLYFVGYYSQGYLSYGNYVISNMCTINDNDNGFISHNPNKGASRLWIRNITFNGANIYSYASENTSSLHSGVVIGASRLGVSGSGMNLAVGSNTTYIMSVKVIYSTVKCTAPSSMSGQCVGMIAGYLEGDNTDNSYLGGHVFLDDSDWNQNLTSSNNTINAINVQYVGGLVGSITNYKVLYHIDCTYTTINANNVFNLDRKSAVGGLFGKAILPGGYLAQEYNNIDFGYTGFDCAFDDVTVNATNMYYVGGETGYFEIATEEIIGFKYRDRNSTDETDWNCANVYATNAAVVGGIYGNMKAIDGLDYRPILGNFRYHDAELIINSNNEDFMGCAGGLFGSVEGVAIYEAMAPGAAVGFIPATIANPTGTNYIIGGIVGKETNSKISNIYFEAYWDCVTGSSYVNLASAATTDALIGEINSPRENIGIGYAVHTEYESSQVSNGTYHYSVLCIHNDYSQLIYCDCEESNPRTDDFREVHEIVYGDSSTISGSSAFKSANAYHRGDYLVDQDYVPTLVHNWWTVSTTDQTFDTILKGYTNSASPKTITNRTDWLLLRDIGRFRYGYTVKTYSIINVETLSLGTILPLGSEMYPFYGDIVGASSGVHTIKIDGYGSYNGSYTVGYDQKYGGLIGYGVGCTFSRFQIRYSQYVSYDLRLQLYKDYQGALAGYLRECTVEDIYFESCTEGNSSGTGDYIGGLVGYACNTIISNCEWVYSSDKNWQSSCLTLGGENHTYVGGIVGYMESTADGLSVLENCSNYDSVPFSGGSGAYEIGLNISGDQGVGGIVGFMTGSKDYLTSHIPTADDNNSRIYGCKNSGDVTADNQFAGGIVGYCQFTYIESCTIEKDAWDRGEPVSNPYDLVITSYWHAGGIVGYSRFNHVYDNRVSAPDINCEDGVGGLIGTAESTNIVNNSVFTATITSKYTAIGGLVGYYDMNVYYKYPLDASIDLFITGNTVRYIQFIYSGNSYGWTNTVGALIGDIYKSGDGTRTITFNGNKCSVRGDRIPTTYINKGETSTSIFTYVTLIMNSSQEKYADKNYGDTYNWYTCKYVIFNSSTWTFTYGTSY